MGRRDWWLLALMTAVFAAFFYAPLEHLPYSGAVPEALLLTQWYAREHVLLCLVPAFFIAGAIAVFVSQGAVIRYLGARANKVLAYGVASVSGSVLAVCSCTVLPLFAGIYRRGAGLGPATAFLYSGPAINVLAIILTARILGLQLGVARAVGAVVFSIVVGLLMHLIFRKEERARAEADWAAPDADDGRPLWQNGLYFAALVAILVFANWGKPDAAAGFWQGVYSAKWLITGVAAVALGLMLVYWIGIRWWKVTSVGAVIVALAVLVPYSPLVAFGAGVIGLSVMTATTPGEGREWWEQTWGFTRQIMPLLFYGILIAGFLLGRPGHEGLMPSAWVAEAVGGNSLGSNLVASVAGAFMYFATLTEVPILQGLMGSGMGKGPALALLLAGPALSLPNMLVIRSVMGTRKTLVFVALVVVLATVAGLIFGATV